MAIPVTKPTTVTLPADLVRIVSGVVALEIGTQKNFHFNGGFRWKGPQPQFIDHKGYNGTLKMLVNDLTEVLETDHAEIMLELEGHTADVMTYFINAAAPTYANCRIWGFSTKDTGDIVRLMTSEFFVYAFTTGEVSYVREDWAKIPVTLRVASTLPTWTIDADTVP